jgi:Homeodomain-like domain
MSKARLVLTALFVEHQTPTEVAARYGVHRGWVYKLRARYQAEGEAAFEPRSRRPMTSPTAIPADVVELIVRLRNQLAEQGLDAGPDTIVWHLRHHHQRTVVDVISCHEPCHARCPRRPVDPVAFAASVRRNGESSSPGWGADRCSGGSRRPGLLLVLAAT